MVSSSDLCPAPEEASSDVGGRAGAVRGVPEEGVGRTEDAEGSRDLGLGTTDGSRGDGVSEVRHALMRHGVEAK